MNTSYKIKTDYLYVKVSGEFIFNAARGILSELVDNLRGCYLNQIFCDISSIQGVNTRHPSTMEKFDMCISAVELIPKNIKLAVLITSQQMEKDSFSESVMVNRGLIVKISSSKKELFKWLRRGSSENDHKSSKEHFIYLCNNL